MARTANEELLDAAVRHQIYLLRYSGYVRNRINAILERSEEDIADKIVARLEKNQGLTTAVEVQRMQALKATIATIRMRAWEKANAYFLEEMEQLAYQEPVTTSAIVKTVIPVEMATVMPTANLLKSIAMSRPFEGRIMKDWASTLAAEDIRRMQNQIQMGMVAGEDMNTIRRRVVGSAALHGGDGITQLTRNQVQSVVRTAVQHVANNARNQFFLANVDIVDLEQFVATLDSRTTPVCRANDGKQYPLGKGPIPPLHYACRSLRVAALSAKRLGERPANPTTERILVTEYAEENNLGSISSRDSLPRGTKGDYDAWARKRIRELVGPIPAATNYQQFLEKQSLMFQEDVLGKTKAKLFRDGKLPLDKFVDRTGAEMTLGELAKKHKEAFTAAGLDPSKYF